MEIETIVRAQHDYFLRGETQRIAFRKEALAKLRGAIKTNEQAICDALQADLHKSATESYLCEIGLVLEELSYMEKHLARLAKPRRAPTPLAQFYAHSFAVPSPLGVCLVMSPWNYPFMLSLDPVIGALAAGNCVVLKPSAYAPQVSAVLAKLLGDIFSPEYVAVVEGGRAENTALLEQPFDHIFFTGSKDVGKLVMEKAARHLTPVVLELGGKSPCIVDASAELAVAAKRIVFGKYLNAGQTCVAPDYLLVHESVKDKLLVLLQTAIADMFGANPLQNPDYGRIVNEKHFARLQSLLDGQKIVCGGDANAAALQIVPTVLDRVSPASPVMQEEIFGPILPVLTFKDTDEAIRFVQSRDRPLALYLFTTDPSVEHRVLTECRFGGGCINDTVIHLAGTALGFGGVGESGMGSYHGKLSFDTFTHYKSIVKKANRIDMPIRYQPYTARKAKLLRLFLK
ncbi:MAG: aldehyde dehydrogenase [Ruthenibacterium sp.]